MNILVVDDEKEIAKLEGEDDFYELFFAGLEQKKIKI